MDNDNRGNNSGSVDFSALQGINRSSEKADRSNTSKKDVPSNIDIGSINNGGDLPFKPQQKKEKFVVHFNTEEFSSTVKTRGRKSAASAEKGPEKPTVPNAIPISKKSGQQRQAKPADTPEAPQQPSPAEPVDEKAAKKAEKKDKAKSKRSARRRAFLPFLILVLIASTTISAVGISCINDVLALGRSEENVAVNIPTDVDANDIIDILAENDLVHQKAFCKFFFRLKNAVFEKKKDESYIDSYKRDPTKELTFLSGVYYVKSNIGLEGFMNKFQKAQETESTINVAFPEGWTVYQMFDKLESFGVCSKAELVAAITGADYDYDFIDDINPGADRVFKLEGYLFPDTYEFYEISDANSIIRKMLANFEEKWNDDYAPKAKELGMEMDDIIKIASIIEREAANKSQMKLVSSVIHNRLNNSVSFPTLGCDSTLNYINKFVAPNVSTMQVQTFEGSYNTAAIAGLPAGPICNPGADAIEAALNPEDTDYYYFCHDKSGKIYLAKTNIEHDANLLEVLRVNNG